MDVYVYKEVDLDVYELESKVGELDRNLGEGPFTQLRERVSQQHGIIRWTYSKVKGFKLNHT